MSEDSKPETKSPTIIKLAEAMAKAQGALEGALKDKTNPFFKSKYADLGSVVSVLKKPLSDNGLSYVQVAHERPIAAAIETIILHSSGEFLSCGIVSVPVSKEDAQGYGSAMTYARRYSLSAAFGVAPEDDDGNAAAQAAPPPGSAAAVKKDAWDNLDADKKIVLADLAADVKRLVGNGDIAGGCMALEEKKLDADDKVAIWSLFDPALRKTIKEFGTKKAMQEAIEKRKLQEA